MTAATVSAHPPSGKPVAPRVLQSTGSSAVG